jgi:hypothetical protein
MAPVGDLIAAVASVSAPTSRQASSQISPISSYLASRLKLGLACRGTGINPNRSRGVQPSASARIGPGGEKPTPVLDAAAPAVLRDELRASGFQGGEGAPQRTRNFRKGGTPGTVKTDITYPGSGFVGFVSMRGWPFFRFKCPQAVEVGHAFAPGLTAGLIA